MSRDQPMRRYTLKQNAIGLGTAISNPRTLSISFLGQYIHRGFRAFIPEPDTSLSITCPHDLLHNFLTVFKSFEFPAFLNASLPLRSQANGVHGPHFFSFFFYWAFFTIERTLRFSLYHHHHHHQRNVLLGIHIHRNSYFSMKTVHI